MGRGTEIVLTSLEGNELEFVLRFNLKVSNNKVEYEAIIASKESKPIKDETSMPKCSKSKEQSPIFDPAMAQWWHRRGPGLVRPIQLEDPKLFVIQQKGQGT